MKYRVKQDCWYNDRLFKSNGGQAIVELPEKPDSPYFEAVAEKPAAAEKKVPVKKPTKKVADKE